MTIALDTDLRQVYEPDVTAMAIHRIAPQARHLEPRAPAVLGRQPNRLVGDVVAVENNDGDVGQCFELFRRYGLTESVSNALAIGAGTSPSGNTKLLPGSNATMARTLRLLIAVSQPGPPH